MRLAFSDRVQKCVVLISVVLILIYLCEMLYLLPQRYVKNYNEGWNAYQSLRAISGSSLYTDPNSYTSNDYAPLYFYITGYIGQFVGDNVITGRVMALIGLLIVSLAPIAIITRKLCDALWMGVFAALLFLTNVLAWYPQYVAMGDPQWVGQ